jgi:hypothetical protein
VARPLDACKISAGLHTHRRNRSGLPAAHIRRQARTPQTQGLYHSREPSSAPVGNLVLGLLGGGDVEVLLPRPERPRDHYVNLGNCGVRWIARENCIVLDEDVMTHDHELSLFRDVLKYA